MSDSSLSAHEEIRVNGSGDASELQFRVRTCRRCKGTDCHCQLERRAYQRYVTGVNREAKLGRVTEMTFAEFWSWAEVHLNDPCAECGSVSKTHVDHVIPLSRNGRHAIGNLQMLCQSCNSRKGAWIVGEVRHYPDFIEKRRCKATVEIKA